MFPLLFLLYFLGVDNLRLVHRLITNSVAVAPVEAALLHVVLEVPLGVDVPARLVSCHDVGACPASFSSRVLSYSQFIRCFPYHLGEMAKPSLVTVEVKVVLAYLVVPLRVIYKNRKRIFFLTELN